MAAAAASQLQLWTSGLFLPFQKRNDTLYLNLHVLDIMSIYKVKCIQSQYTPLQRLLWSPWLCPTLTSGSRWLLCSLQNVSNLQLHGSKTEKK